MKGKRIISWILAAALSFGALTGCTSSGGGTDGEKKDTSTAKGRYLEADVELPENTSVYDMVKLEDGTVRIALNDQDGRESVWNLKEDGTSWEKVYDMPEEWTMTDTFFVSHVTLSPKGDAFVVTSQVFEGEEESQEHYYHLDGEGKATEVPLQTENYVYFTDYTREGEFLVQCQHTPVSSVNMETGEMTDKVSGTEDIRYFGVAANTLYAVDRDGQILLFDLLQPDVVEKDDGLSDSIAQSGANTDLQSLQTKPLIFVEGKEENEVFYCSNKGLYRHIRNGDVSELLIDGSLTSLGSPDVGLITMETAENNEFYVLAVDSQSVRLLHYTYSKDTAAVPGTEVRAWSLRENSELLQNISQYQKENPDVYVTLDIGSTEENGVTASDALKNLSTEIMAGNGPDLLVLDGLPMDSYLEKGMLEDLTDVADQGEHLFTNLLENMKQDGKIYGIPLRFALPLVEGKKQDLEKIHDLKSLADLAEELKGQDSEKTLYNPYYDGFALAAQLYDACSPAWIQEDGKIAEEKLTEFYTQVGRIFDPESYPITNSNVLGEYSQTFTSSIGGGTLELYCDKLLLNFGNICSGTDLAMLATTVKEKEEIGYQPLTGQAAHVFLPKAVMGISTKSKEKEESKKFLQFLLTKDAQTAAQGGGLPVNQEALEFLIDNIYDGSTFGSSRSDDPDSYVEMTIHKPDADAVGQFIDYVKEADTPALTNEIIREAVLEQASDCVEGKITPEEAVKAVTEKVSLYLAE